MTLYEDGKEYWTIARRFHAHRTQPLMWKVATKDMKALLERTKNNAVRSRILMWLARNQYFSPDNSGGRGGPPRVA